MCVCTKTGVENSKRIFHVTKLNGIRRQRDNGSDYNHYLYILNKTKMVILFVVLNIYKLMYIL